VTSRYQGYQGRVDLGPAFCQFHVKPLNETQVAEFVDHWYRAVFPAAAWAGGGHRRARRGGDRFAHGDVAAAGVSDRAPARVAGPIRSCSRSCAWCITRTETCRGGAQTFTAAVSGCWSSTGRKEVRDLQGVSGYDPEAAEAGACGRRVVLHEEEGARTQKRRQTRRCGGEVTGPILPRGRGWGATARPSLSGCGMRAASWRCGSAGQCGFLHLTFQEYLAGLHAAREGKAEELVKHIGKSWWREVTLVAVAIGSKDFATKFFNALVADDDVSKEGPFVDSAWTRRATQSWSRSSPH